MTDQSKKMGDFFGNNFGDNTVIQSENVQQSKVVNSGELDNAFNELATKISEIKDDQKREQAEFFAQQLKLATEKDDKITGKQMIKFLNGILGTASSLITIASVF
ncbi:hypothetical protein M3205_06115 [Cytobacillus firmus]|uniref:hypothetical protein n=1 Tax=Cytobacillus firmus TaxID=1399 RepID=UPI00203E137F|nr:hypothetical protein [Cytobacillus firmus]MCM3705302.1 hypothetical protein [Cytobacillus firmus]